MTMFKDAMEDAVWVIVEKDGRYIGKVGCLLCLPLRRAAARLVESGELKCLGVWDGKQVWVKREETN